MSPGRLQVRLALEMMFEGIQGAGDLGHVTSNGLPPGQGQVLRVGEAVTVMYKEGMPQQPKQAPVAPHVVLEWQGGSEADMIADAVVAIILQVGSTCKWLSRGSNPRHPFVSRWASLRVGPAAPFPRRRPASPQGCRRSRCSGSRR